MSARKAKELFPAGATELNCAVLVVTLPAAARSISTESLTLRNNVLGFFIPHFA